MDEQTMDTDGAHDHAEQRRELKRVWKRLAARYCREVTAKPAAERDVARAWSSMVLSYEEWRAAH